MKLFKRVILGLIGILNFTGCRHIPQLVTCRERFTLIGKICLMFDKTKKGDFYTQRERCEKIGAYLIEHADHESQIKLISYLKSHWSNYRNSLPRYWIGLLAPGIANNLSDSRNYRWLSDGRPNSDFVGNQPPWADNFPIDEPDYVCVRSNTFGFWENVPCSYDVYALACQYHPKRRKIRKKPAVHHEATSQENNLHIGPKIHSADNKKNNLTSKPKITAQNSKSLIHDTNIELNPTEPHETGKILQHHINSNFMLYNESEGLEPSNGDYNSKLVTIELVANNNTLKNDENSKVTPNQLAGPIDNETLDDTFPEFEQKPPEENSTDLASVKSAHEQRFEDQEVSNHSIYQQVNQTETFEINEHLNNESEPKITTIEPSKEKLYNDTYPTNSTDNSTEDNEALDDNGNTQFKPKNPDYDHKAFNDDTSDQNRPKQLLQGKQGKKDDIHAHISKEQTEDHRDLNDNIHTHLVPKLHNRSNKTLNNGLYPKIMPNTIAEGSDVTNQNVYVKITPNNLSHNNVASNQNIYLKITPKEVIVYNDALKQNIYRKVTSTELDDDRDAMSQHSHEKITHRKSSESNVAFNHNNFFRVNPKHAAKNKKTLKYNTFSRKSMKEQWPHTPLLKMTIINIQAVVLR